MTFNCFTDLSHFQWLSNVFSVFCLISDISSSSSQMCPYYHFMESEWVHCSYVTSTRFMSTNEGNHDSIGLIIDIGLNITGIVAGSPHKTPRNSMLFWPKEKILYYCNLPFGIHCIPQGKILCAIIYSLEGGYSNVTGKDSRVCIS
jgi:hypothetical protein